MKLELKHIQHYPIGGDNALIVKTDRTSLIHKVRGILKNYLIISDFDVPIRIEFCKPLLRPMSDLYKERNGKVDIVELAKIATSESKYCSDLCWTVEGSKDKYATARKEEYEFTFDYDVSGAFWISKYDVYDKCSSDIDINSQLDLFEYLFAHHYDIYRLLDQNLAIDLNTIEG